MEDLLPSKLLKKEIEEGEGKEEGVVGGGKEEGENLLRFLTIGGDYQLRVWRERVFVGGEREEEERGSFGGKVIFFFFFFFWFLNLIHTST